MMQYTPLVVTDLDAARIRELGQRLPDGGRGLQSLRDLVEKVQEDAEIVPGPRVSADVVTMNSTVSFRDEQTGLVSRMSLVYPAEMSIAAHRISVLSPVGRALLGRKVGDVAEVELPDDSQRVIRVLEIHYQPEASGDFNL
ncbi:MAG: nucleoside diphosphate kinase regulator [Betaproteobacteria bacterium]|nr:nucleoside diphosphate kinase regulator [Betaproteobacteria bacterium]